MSEPNGEIDDILREIENKANADLPNKSERAAVLIAAFSTCLVDHILPDHLREVFQEATELENTAPKLLVDFPSYLQSARGQAVLKRMRDAIDDFLNAETNDDGRP